MYDTYVRNDNVNALWEVYQYVYEFETPQNGLAFHPTGQPSAESDKTFLVLAVAPQHTDVILEQKSQVTI